MLPFLHERAERPSRGGSDHFLAVRKYLTFIKAKRIVLRTSEREGEESDLPTYLGERERTLVPPLTDSARFRLPSFILPYSRLRRRFLLAFHASLIAPNDTCAESATGTAFSPSRGQKLRWKSWVRLATEVTDPPHWTPPRRAA